MTITAADVKKLIDAEESRAVEPCKPPFLMAAYELQEALEAVDRAEGALALDLDWDEVRGIHIDAFFNRIGAG